MGPHADKPTEGTDYSSQAALPRWVWDEVGWGGGGGGGGGGESISLGIRLQMQCDTCHLMSCHSCSRIGRLQTLGGTTHNPAPSTCIHICILEYRSTQRNGV